jgi:ribonuclease HII
MQTGIPEIDDSTADLILGTDESGYGAWAGRLYVGGAVVPRGWKGIRGLTDSKAIDDERERERIASEFKALADDKEGHRCLFMIRYAEPSEIDKDGVWNVLHRLHRACIQSLRGTVEGLWGTTPLIVADGNLKLEGVGAISLPKADALVPAVSMASVLAKVARDATMHEAERLYPGYDFANNKAYGAPRHRQGLDRLGPCPIHRRSYKPIADMVRDKGPTNAEIFMSLFDE